MSFYVSEKVEYHHGIPSFDFITKEKKHYVVFPKEKIFKTYDAQDRAAYHFMSKMHGPAKDEKLDDPFSTEVWHQNEKQYDVMLSGAVKQYLDKRNNGEEGEQFNMFDKAVRVAMEQEQQRKLKLLRRVLDLRQQKTTPKSPKIEIPKKGPGSYRRDKQIDL